MLYFSAARGFTRAAPLLNNFFALPPASPSAEDADTHFDRQVAEPWRDVGHLNDDGGGERAIGGHRSPPQMAAVATSAGGGARERHARVVSGGSSGGNSTGGGLRSVDPTFSFRFRQGIEGSGAGGAGGDAVAELQRQMSASSGFGLQMLREESREALVGGDTSTPASKTTIQQRSWLTKDEGAAAVAAAAKRQQKAQQQERALTRTARELEPMEEEPLTRSEPARTRRTGDFDRGGGGGRVGEGRGGGGERTPRGGVSSGPTQHRVKKSPTSSDRNHLHLFQSEPAESEVAALAAAVAAARVDSANPPPLPPRERKGGAAVSASSATPSSTSNGRGSSSQNHDRKERERRDNRPRDDRSRGDGSRTPPPPSSTATQGRRGTHDGGYTERPGRIDRETGRLPTRKPKEVAGPTRVSPRRRGTTGGDTAVPNHGGASSTPFAPRISTVFASAPSAAATAVAEGGDFVRRHLHLKKAFPGIGGGSGSGSGGSGETKRAPGGAVAKDEERRRRRQGQDSGDRSKRGDDSRVDRPNVRSASPVDRHRNASSPRGPTAAEYLSDSRAGSRGPSKARDSRAGSGVDHSGRASRTGSAPRDYRAGSGVDQSGRHRRSGSASRDSRAGSAVDHSGRTSRTGSATRDSRAGSGVDKSGRGSRAGSAAQDGRARAGVDSRSRTSSSAAPSAPLPFTSSADVAVSALEAQIAADAVSPDGALEARRERRRFGGIERTLPGRSNSPPDSRSVSPVDRRPKSSGRPDDGGAGKTRRSGDARARRASSPASTSPPAATPGGGVDGSTSSSSRRHSGIGKVLRGGGDKLKQLATLRKDKGGTGGGTGSSSTAAHSAVTGDRLETSPVGGAGRWHRPGHRFFTAPRANARGVDDFTAGNFRSAPGVAAATKSPTHP